MLRVVARGAQQRRAPRAGAERRLPVRGVQVRGGCGGCCAFRQTRRLPRDSLPRAARRVSRDAERKYDPRRAAGAPVTPLRASCACWQPTAACPRRFTGAATPRQDSSLQKAIRDMCAVSVGRGPRGRAPPARRARRCRCVAIAAVPCRPTFGYRPIGIDQCTWCTPCRSCRRCGRAVRHARRLAHARQAAHGARMRQRFLAVVRRGPLCA